MPSPATDARPESQGQEPRFGALLGGKYRVEGLLGRGGTGNVYRAIQEPIGRAVAVKILRVDLPPEEQRQFEIRFLREASQAGALQHPNVVTVHDFGREDDGTCYIVMELLRGRSLKDVLKDGPMPARRALDVFEQMIRGLRAAHHNGMVHRDVKPGNITLLVGDDGRDLVKILDFGLVKDLDAIGGLEDGGAAASLIPEDDLSAESTVTRHGLFLGTPHYVAPEQARGARVDGRADLYSAGVVLYRMVTGVLPYFDRDAAVMAQAHVSAPYPPMRERAPGVAVPPVVEELVRRCMEKEPALRYPDADALLADLVVARRALEPAPAELGVHSESTASLVQPLPVAPPPPAKPARSRAGLALGLLLLLGGGAAAALLWPEPASELKPADPVLEPAAPAARTVNVFLASAPPGAEVRLGEDLLGTTPFVWRREVPAGEAAPTLSLSFALEGYEPATQAVTLEGEELVVNASLVAVPRAPEPRRSTQPRAEAKTGTKAADTKATETKLKETSDSSTSGTLLADGIPFTAAQAAATVTWLNGATESQLYGAGIAPRQVHLIQDGRPWKDIQSFAATLNIGEKTVAAARDAASR